MNNHWQKPLADVLATIDEDIKALSADLARLTKVRDGIRALIPPGTPTTIAMIAHKKPKAKAPARPLNPNAELILKVITDLPQPATAKDLVDFARAAGWQCASQNNAVSVMSENLRKLADRQLVTRSKTKPSLWSARG